jgi:hypothetical protein
MVIVPLIEGVHSIGAQAKPNIPWVLVEILVLVIKALPLSTIGRVCNHIIVNLALIVPPCHERSFLRV